MNIWLFIGLIIGCSVLSAFASYKIFYKKGRHDGAKNREKEILEDYVAYIPLDEIPEFARDLIEEQGADPSWPMLVIRSDAYDYIEDDPLYK